MLSHEAFFRVVETTTIVRSFKAVLLESLLDNDGFRHPPRLEDLASQALAVFRRRRGFVSDLRSDLRDLDSIDPAKWLTYWKGNPINAWSGGNKSENAKNWFIVREGRFQPNFDISDAEIQTFQSMDGDYLLLELLDPAHAGSITGNVMVVERQDAGGDDQ
ncbi:MAG TPA: hypothetical protein VES73_04070, partial [Lamprocystis sp. (in: g-proteobacteria)]|nr:hypothetical protein [Lamprocystis sp. (in: g-proteobacteria)]